MHRVSRLTFYHMRQWRRNNHGIGYINEVGVESKWRKNRRQKARSLRKANLFCTAAKVYNNESEAVDAK